MKNCLFVSMLFVAACAGGGRISYVSPSDAFQKGMVYYESGRYTRAAEYFRGVFDFGRAHEWADEAQLQLARALRMNQEYITAASEYTRFMEFFRTDPRVPDAEYERAMTYYEQSPRIELDQTSTRRGIEAFNLYIQRFPAHDSVEAAVRRVAELRQKLAEKQFYNARLYERRGLYEAAALSYELTFDKFPDTPLADDALMGAIRSYIRFSDQSVEQRQAERLQKAIDHFDRMAQIFPESDLIGSARRLAAEASGRLDQLVSDESSL